MIWEHKGPWEPTKRIAFIGKTKKILHQMWKRKVSTKYGLCGKGTYFEREWREVKSFAGWEELYNYYGLDGCDENT